MVAALLFIRSFRNAIDVDFGVDLENIVVARVELDPARHSGADRRRLFEEMSEAVQRLPDVSQASASMGPPIGSVWRRYVSFEIPGYEWPWGEGRPAGEARAFVEAVTPGYLGMLGMRMVRGRGFESAGAGARKM